MSDNYSDDLDSDIEEDSLPGLRRAANKSKKLESENQSLKRELAFAKAGLPLDDPKMRYFVKGYDGEMEAEAIRAAAVEAGFYQQPAQGEQPATQSFNDGGQQRVMAASAGSISEDISEAAAIARMEQAMSEGGVEAMFDVARQYGIPIASEQ
jgi:hypothetical protein